MMEDRLKIGDSVTVEIEGVDVPARIRAIHENRYVLELDRFVPSGHRRVKVWAGPPGNVRATEKNGKKTAGDEKNT